MRKGGRRLSAPRDGRPSLWPWKARTKQRMPDTRTRMPTARVPTPITPAQSRVYVLLSVDTPIGPAALSRTLGVSPTTIGGQLRALQQKGYAIRRDDGWRAAQ